MKDRIKINGEWYVREDHANEIELDATAFNGRVYESDLYCFEANQGIGDDGSVFDECTIEVTDKREKPWKVEYVDNMNWAVGVLDNNPESMNEAKEMFCAQGLLEFRSVVRDLIKVGWITRK